MDLKSKILAVAIGLVLTFFVFYGIETFYPGPEWDDFCEPKGMKAEDQTQCEAAGGKWQLYADEPYARPVQPEGDGWCDLQYYCRQDYDEVNDVYERNVFAIGSILGIILFIIGFTLGVEAVAGGILGGSVLILFVTVMRYWDHLHDYFRLIILGVVLSILIYIGYKKLPQGSKTSKSKKKK